MAKSLQEQMLKMGLMNKQQANKVKKEQSKKNKQQRNKKGTMQDENKLQAQLALTKKAQHDRKLNLQRKQQAEQKAITAQIKQLILLYRLPDEKEGETYNFTDQKKIKTVYISESVRDQISRGRQAIVKLESKYCIVPSEVAHRIKQRDEKVVIVLNERNKMDKDEDDPYADFEVPDDLMW